MSDAIPIFEVKNKLPFFVHKAETEGPVAISRRDKEVAFIISKEEYEKLSNSAPHEETIVETAARLRKEFGINDEEFNFDLADFIESVKEPSVYGSSRDRQIEYEMKRLQK